MRSCVLAVVAALSLASCGGSSSTSTNSARAPSAPPAPTTQTTQTATAPPPAATKTVTVTQTSPAPSGPHACVASGLALFFIGQQGATGHGLLGFGLRNTSGQSCRTYGYPGILFLSASGQALPTVPTHTTQDFFGTTPLSALVVAPDTTVSFRLGVTHGAASPAGCTTAYGLQVIAPNDTVALRTNIPGGAYECQSATVSPLRSRTSAYP